MDEVMAERRRCWNIVQAARCGDIDQDFRCVAAWIDSGAVLVYNEKTHTWEDPDEGKDAGYD